MTRRGITHACLLALCAAASGTAPAGADTAGGASATPVPRVSYAVCRTECAGVRAARPGSTIRVRGRYLDSADSVVFLGGPGGADDVDAAPSLARSRFLDVVVPRTAVGGAIAVMNIDGAQSRSTRRAMLVIDPNAPEPQKTSAKSSDGELAIDIEVQNRRVFFGAERKATLVYMIRHGEPANVTVELVRVEDGVPIARWDAGIVAPGTPQTIEWNGTAGGVVQKDGRYQFRVYAQDGAGVRAQSAQAGEPATPDTFLFVRNKFPVRGAHTYGDGFGAGRGHQGADVFARCGTPLVATRSGVVKIKQRHSRAGNYVVIDGDDTGVDYVYMHLRKPALVNKGDHVFTGQQIGEVGQTGRASGCHLHFELWDEPGWYTGGKPFDPVPHLRGWDALS